MGIDWKPGKQSLAKPHRGLVVGEPTRSADLDSGLKAQHQDATRWDYVLEASRRKSGKRRGAAVEVHSGNTSEVSLMIDKKKWAVAVLADLEPDLPIERWHWVVPPDSKFRFPPTGPAARRLAGAGIGAPTRQVGGGELFG